MKSLLLATVGSLLLVTSCSSTSVEGGAAGATRGAFYGAVSSGVVAAVFGGDVGDSMARGAVAGGTIGGISGAVSGAERDRQQKQIAEIQAAGRQPPAQTKPNADELRAALIELVGPDNTAAVEYLVDCKHDQAMTRIRRAAVSSNKEFKLAALWLEVLTELDRRDMKAAKAVYPTIVVQDDRVATVEDAEKEALDLLSKLENTRAEFGLPRRCN